LRNEQSRRRQRAHHVHPCSICIQGDLRGGVYGLNFGRHDVHDRRKLGGVGTLRGIGSEIGEDGLLDVYFQAEEQELRMVKGTKHMPYQSMSNERFWYTEKGSTDGPSSLHSQQE
jgi:hypothetical protein